MEQEFTEFSEFEESDKSLKQWIGLNLKIMSLTVSCWHCGSILVSYTRGGCFEPFTLMTNIFVTEFSENI